MTIKLCYLWHFFDENKKKYEQLMSFCKNLLVTKYHLKIIICYIVCYVQIPLWFIQ